MTARIAALVLIVLALARPARADDGDSDEVLAARRALIVLRILAYDKALATRAPGDDVVVVLLAGAGPEARVERELWQAGFALLPKVKAGGRPVRAVALDYRDPAGLDAAIAALRPAALIVGPGLASVAGALQHVARARHVVTVSTREPEVRAGFAIGLIAGEHRDEIVVNLAAARAEGARFGAGLLQLARLVDGAGP